MQTQHLLEQFAAGIGIPGARFDHDGLCQLTIDNDFDVAIRQDSDDTLTLIGVVARDLPRDLSPAIQAELLADALNPLKRQAPGLGIEAQTRSLLLYWTLEVTRSSLADFHDRFSLLIESMRDWRMRLSRHGDDQPQPSPHHNLA
ncbi:CesT family type III secretion system chaperone [Chromobacterium vaccinii]|uniref:type III secretion system chaperone n=1 Tax=Chromobacterium vaccinii TaxID=1108595 RepID=UPI000617C8CD|nr:type III secretion system chaperone [Chromobacterium vaccinii]QND86217.1 CesT family type III secretion system chaperone [Chromobacterium vaccinii]QND91448.1 CesT family type III secretion system chaperone [Chromobacterium vaccinii]